MVGADQPQIVRPSALHESQIACVIDNAGEIRVFVIHAHGLMVSTVVNFAIESIHGELFTDSAERHQSFRTPTQPFIGVKRASGSTWSRVSGANGRSGSACGSIQTT